MSTLAPSYFVFQADSLPKFAIARSAPFSKCIGHSTPHATSCFLECSTALLRNTPGLAFPKFEESSDSQPVIGGHTESNRRTHRKQAEGHLVSRRHRVEGLRVCSPSPRPNTTRCGVLGGGAGNLPTKLSKTRNQVIPNVDDCNR